MESLTFYVSKDQNRLFDKKDDLKDEYPFLFPEELLGHPCHHVKWITDLIVRCAPKYHNGHTNIITHSKTMINAVGDYIEYIDPEFRHKVSIIILNEDGSSRTSTFDEEGMLLNWEIGFFSGDC